MLDSDIEDSIFKSTVGKIILVFFQCTFCKHILKLYTPCGGSILPNPDENNQVFDWKLEVKAINELKNGWFSNFDGLFLYLKFWLNMFIYQFSVSSTANFQKFWKFAILPMEDLFNKHAGTRVCYRQTRCIVTNTAMVLWPPYTIHRCFVTRKHNVNSNLAGNQYATNLSYFKPHLAKMLAQTCC